MFRVQTKALWQLTQIRPPYKCSENCQAPSRFYLGEPWLKVGDEDVEEGTVNFEISCKIWDGLAITGRNSDEITWTFNGFELFMQNTDNSSMINHEVRIICFFLLLADSCIFMNFPQRLDMYGINVFPPQVGEGSMFAVSKLVIKRVNGTHLGEYKCKNSNGASTWQLSIPFWTTWGSWTQCTEKCKKYPDGAPGVRRRSRTCIGHKDEATTCSKSEHGDLQEEPCTGNQGSADTFCTVPPKVEDWSDWSPCSQSCGGGTRGRTRVCKEGKFGARHSDDLCPTPGHATFEQQWETCNTDICPKNCEWHDWGNWGPCSQTCRKGNSSGRKTRTKKIKTAAKGKIYSYL